MLGELIVINATLATIASLILLLYIGYRIFVSPTSVSRKRLHQKRVEAKRRKTTKQEESAKMDVMKQKKKIKKKDAELGAVVDKVNRLFQEEKKQEVSGQTTQIKGTPQDVKPAEPAMAANETKKKDDDNEEEKEVTRYCISYDPNGVTDEVRYVKKGNRYIMKKSVGRDTALRVNDCLRVEEEEEAICCTACGASEGDDIKLQQCDGCDLALYCSDDCKSKDRPNHEKACKERAAKLREARLFRQPKENYMGDCPICLVPLPNEIDLCVMQACCSKWVCVGCSYANREREKEEGLKQTCVFCREVPPETNELAEKKKLERVEKNDALAMSEVGKRLYWDGNERAAVEYWRNAVQLDGPGAVDAHDNLALCYEKGTGGVKIDMEKHRWHLEEAAMAGHPKARLSLANLEGKNGNHHIAVKHALIAMHQGYAGAMKLIGRLYASGVMNKTDYAKCLRVYQEAVEKTKTPQREAALVARKEGRFQEKHFPQYAKNRPATKTKVNSTTAGVSPAGGTKAKGKKGKGKKKQRQQQKIEKKATATSKEQDLKKAKQLKQLDPSCATKPPKQLEMDAMIKKSPKKL